MTDVPESPQPFDVCGPLPTGTTVLEASAGTGKTFAIAALVARYVAAGVPLQALLVVTFTRMATGELRDRVRERLVSAEQRLDRVLAGAEPDGDEVDRLLAAGDEAEVAARRDRLGRALADFDAATIATTHGFCQEVLDGLGRAGDVEPDAMLVEDAGDLLEEVVDDLYVRRFHRREEPPFGRDEALAIARMAIENPGARIEPAQGPHDSYRAMRARLAHAAREEFDLRKRRLGIMTYDDVLIRLAGTLDGDFGAAAAARLRERYQVVLVDEFQDTDSVQWSILRRAFGEGVTLVLIGDPKQAIYAFRGADVYAYLEAARSASSRQTLQVNWRSDQGLLDAYDALFAGARLGHEGIAYRRVEAAEANRSPRLSGAPCPAPLRVRVAHRDEPTIGRTPSTRVARRHEARIHIARDLAADLVALLRSGARVERRASDGTTIDSEPVCPGHVAVLTRTHRSAALVRDALEEVRIPAVISGAGSVFASAPARDWLRLLEALERPASARRAHAVALTPFLGWDAERVACAGEGEWEQVHERLHRWARLLSTRGVASLLAAITRAEGLPARVLRTADGERRLTDLRHVGQLLHATATDEQMGTAALTAWLRQRIANAAQETGNEERSRRLESDAEAVQVLTIHRSKGLEFPIVYCPFLWDPGSRPDDTAAPVFFHDPGRGDVRTIDVGLEGADYVRHRRRHEDEERGEELRLAYVALTRARHQAVLWWAGSYNCGDSALGRLLFARDAEGNVAPRGRGTPSDEAVVERLRELAAAAPGRISVERSTIGAPSTWAGARASAASLAAATARRRIDLSWRRTSYSDLTAGAHDPRVASEPEDDPALDQDAAVAATPAWPGDAEPEPGAGAPLPVPAQPGEDADALRAVPVALAAMPGGPEVGTFVHRVLQATDFAAGDLDAELARHVAALRARRAIDVGEPETVVGGLRAAIETPLGPAVGGSRLRDIEPADRLDELTFELPLAGGDEPGGALTLAAVAAALERHLPAGDPLADYADRLSDPALRQRVRGYLTGSIDLVARLRGPDGQPRFAVVDYKTNWLAPPGEDLSAWHHRPSALAAEMQRSHYALQGLLYAVALHRYLRWRLPAYAPERHLAGVLYLFVRGMTGPATPTVAGQPCGVFSWPVAPALVQELSAALDTGETR